MSNNDSNKPANDENIVSEYYDNYKETQEYLLQINCRKTRNAIFTIAVLILCGDLLGLAVANAFTTQTFLITLIVPAVLIGIGLIAPKEPMLAIILAALIFAGLIILSIIAYGGIGAISGIIIKAIIVYFLLTGFQTAREAEKIRRELKNS